MPVAQEEPAGRVFVLALVISWGGGAIVHSLELIRPAAPNWVLPAGPLLAALIVAAVAFGRDGLADLVRRALRWRVGLRWYLVAVGLPVAIALADILLSGPLGAAAPDWDRRPPLGFALLLSYFMSPGVSSRSCERSGLSRRYWRCSLQTRCKSVAPRSYEATGGGELAGARMSDKAR